MQARTFGILGTILVGSAIALSPTLSQAGVKTFMVVINGAQETPPNPSAAIGNGVLTYDTGTKTLCWSLSFIGALVGGEVTAHIHGPAAIGVGPAPIVIPLPVGSPKTACVVTIPPFVQGDLLKNRYYVNIHSGGFPAGEIRGQILRIK